MADPQPTERTRTNTGPGRLLIAVYLLFAIAATSRAGLQIATRFETAPMAYLLSAFAATVYIVAAVGLGRAGRTGRLIALACCTVELVGVVGVGAASQARPELFPDETVWSGFGSGYGYIPLVLPVLGLLWLWRTRHDLDLAVPSRPRPPRVPSNQSFGPPAT
ncbi:hypothetical protein [Salinispora tropica]|uniref:Integral membrane protein n=1 Tax=Salinispora tropica (strain ATCC BAA-916 / DSM 44818 / JCM 13857 / NBRC 105044 / CNB-440) TaxID=369723 RepID=A4XB04_SALTO|nr:hypothetical protein [Salinispora tropica]ABP56103.1 hypothetical protein Strop_3672 [Salinispora tropica CNB-440]